MMMMMMMLMMMMIRLTRNSGCSIEKTFLMENQENSFSSAWKKEKDCKMQAAAAARQ